MANKQKDKHWKTSLEKKPPFFLLWRVMYRNFNIPPGNLQPREFDKNLFPVAGNSALGSAREFEPRGGEGPRRGYSGVKRISMGLINKVDMVCSSPVGYGV